MNKLSQEEREHLETKIDTLMKRWRILEEQRVGFGDLHCPAHIRLELTNTESEIREISSKLGISPPFGIQSEESKDKDRKPKKPLPEPKRGIKVSPLKMALVFGIILLCGLSAIKLIFQPQQTGPTKKIEIGLFPPKINVEFCRPIDYYDGLPQSPNPKVKSAFEKGNKYKEKYRFDKAIKEFKQALKLGPADTEKGALHILIGNCLSDQSKYKEALDWYKKAVEITKKISDRAGLATTYNNIGGIHDAQGNYQEALKWYEKSKVILERIGDRHHLALSLRNIALLYRDTGKKDKAKQYLQESYQLYLQLNLKSEAGEVRRLLDSL